MKAPLHGNHRHIGEAPAQESPAVTNRRRSQKMRNLAVLDRDITLDCISKRP
jgi:hypothetical protein